ncbi:MAG: RluA family pseudouridine synthase [Deltaproteobacteria bacterium]|nr:MAG: RluA family pseudouridine synthase [Deltaproteobacteria bacterium]
MTERVWTVPADVAGARLDAVVAERWPELSRSQVRRAHDEGRLTLNGRPPKKAGVPVRAGDVVCVDVHDAPTGEAPQAEAIPLRVVYEDEHLVVVDKPAGLVVHPAPGHAGGTLVNALVHHLDELAESEDAPDRPGIVHRIDKDTSGLLVVAKSLAAMTGLQAQFAAHTAHRRYRAVVLGPRLADEGTFETLFDRHPRDRKRFTGRVSRGRRACTHWRVLARGEALALVELALETGRTHQIRVHMSEHGHPVVADPIYGRPVPKGGVGRAAIELAAARRMPRLALHAAELGFVHPATGEALRFTAPDPEDLARLIATIDAG